VYIRAAFTFSRENDDRLHSRLLGDHTGPTRLPERTPGLLEEPDARLRPRRTGVLGPHNGRRGKHRYARGKTKRAYRAGKR